MASDEWCLCLPLLLLSGYSGTFSIIIYQWPICWTEWTERVASGGRRLLNGVYLSPLKPTIGKSPILIASRRSSGPVLLSVHSLAWRQSRGWGDKENGSVKWILTTALNTSFAQSNLNVRSKRRDQTSERAQTVKEQERNRMSIFYSTLKLAQCGV